MASFVYLNILAAQLEKSPPVSNSPWLLSVHLVPPRSYPLQCGYYHPFFRKKIGSPYLWYLTYGQSVRSQNDPLTAYHGTSGTVHYQVIGVRDC
jgi:hypothetical protein